MSSTLKKSGLLARIRRGRETRKRLVENNLSEGIAFQIAATRDSLGWSQARLAAEAHVSTNLPRLEDPGYGKHTISTLKKLAAAMDVALVVRFVPFSQYIDWISGTPHLDEGIRPDALAVPSFAEEERKGIFDARIKHFSILSGKTAINDHKSGGGMTSGRPLDGRGGITKVGNDIAARTLPKGVSSAAFAKLDNDFAEGASYAR